MTPEDISFLANRMLWTAFLLSMPLLLTALLVGVLISIVQTVTGVQEMTLTFVPKMTAVIVALVVFLPWMSTVLVAYTREILQTLGGGG